MLLPTSCTPLAGWCWAMVEAAGSRAGSRARTCGVSQPGAGGRLPHRRPGGRPPPPSSASFASWCLACTVARRGRAAAAQTCPTPSTAQHRGHAGRIGQPAITNRQDERGREGCVGARGAGVKTRARVLKKLEETSKSGRVARWCTCERSRGAIFDFVWLLRAQCRQGGLRELRGPLRRLVNGDRGGFARLRRASPAAILCRLCAECGHYDRGQHFLCDCAAALREVSVASLINLTSDALSKPRPYLSRYLLAFG